MDEDFELRTQNFLQWLAVAGIKLSSKAKVVDLRFGGAGGAGGQARGRGLVATADFQEDEIIFSIPRSSVLNIKTMQERFLNTNPGVSRSTLFALPPWAALTMMLMSEIQQPDSKWSPYFAVLPTQLDSLVFWTPEQLEELQASAVIDKIGKTGAEATYNVHISKTLANPSIDTFHLIASTIMAYAFDIPEEDEETQTSEDELVPDDEEKTCLSMIPLADMLNADIDNNAQLNYENEDLEMRALRPIKTGEEILNDYGQIPRSDLLRRYGYITDKYAAYDVIEISSTAIVKCWQQMVQLLNRPVKETDLDTRLDLARREDIFEDAYDLSRPNSEVRCIPDELLAFVWLLLVNEMTLKSIYSSKSSFPSRSKMETADVGAFLHQVLLNRQQEYATSIEEDKSILKGSPLPPRRSMAVQVRLGEKLILREALAECATYSGSNEKMMSQDGTHGKRTAERHANGSDQKKARRV